MEDRFIAVRNKTVEICAPLETEDYVVQPCPEVSPPKWHLGHTTWFLEELILNKFSKNYQFYNPTWKKIYNSYYKGLGEHWVQSERGKLSRPLVKEVFNYRQNIENKVQELISRSPGNDELKKAIELAIQHEQQHQELLLMDIKYILGINPEPVTYFPIEMPGYKKAEGKWISFPSGLYEIGALSSQEKFYYDNEAPRHKKYISAFSICEDLVTNNEYFSFIRDGGYQNPKLWLSKGWDWVNEHKIKAPLYWKEREGQWWEFTLYGQFPLDFNAPVSHVSYFEADAYARWKHKRLPTEEEYEVAFEKVSPLWSWTQSHYSPYRGFEPFKGEAAEYNAKFMCNQFVMKGGCFATPEGHYRRTYRNFYEPDQRWMFSGITLAEDKNENS